MRLYHASKCIIKSPDVYHSRDLLDFGKGFYLTSLSEQAKKYALRFIFQGEKAYLNQYELDEDLSKYNVKTSNIMMKNGLILYLSAVLGNRPIYVMLYLVVLQTTKFLTQLIFISQET